MSDVIIASLITGTFGLITGFLTGYQYCIKFCENKNLKQKARDNINQIQIGGDFIDKN